MAEGRSSPTENQPILHQGESIIKNKYASFESTVNAVMDEAARLKRKATKDFGGKDVPDILRSPIGAISMEEIDDVH